MTAAAPTLWLGPFVAEARGAYLRARQAGMSAIRALVLGNIASFREGWMFRKNLALQVGCSVRTAQRAITQAKELGLLGVARAKPKEIPPGLDGPLPFGWSHRWTIGWGQAGAAIKKAIELARLKFTLRRSSRPMPSTPCETAKPKTCAERSPHQGRTWTPAELDAELERAAHAQPPREKPPP